MERTRRAIAMKFGVALLVTVSIVLASCGARTGLLFDETTTIASGVDSGLVVDANAPPDANLTTLSCSPGSITLVKADPTVMFVLDRSGSMGGQLGTTNGNQSRWQILTAALTSALPPVNLTMEVGALLFPTGSGGRNQMSCNVASTPDLEPELLNVPILLALMLDNTPAGETPTSDALNSAATALGNVRAATNARALVLATDGAPNCNAMLDPSTCRCANATNDRACSNSTMCLDATRTVDTIASIEERGIPTFVIGIETGGDADFTDVLNDMATAGGRPQSGAQKYYAGDSEADLTSALVAIRNQVGACTFLTTSVPSADGTITVVVDGTTIPFDATATNGWAWADKPNGQIIFAGDACALVTSTSSPTVVADVQCDLGDASLNASDAAGE
jgi:hypothetical protein